MVTAITCPNCRGKSVQEFKAAAATYYLCQYCRHKWVKSMNQGGDPSGNRIGSNNIGTRSANVSM